MSDLRPAGSRQQAAGSRQQAAGSRQQAAGLNCILIILMVPEFLHQYAVPFNTSFNSSFIYVYPISFNAQ
jgi:hypothetical protein